MCDVKPNLIIGYHDCNAAVSRKLFFMSEEDYNVLMELAERLQREKVSKEEALRSLVRIGLVDENGRLTPPYECLHEILIS
jgi:predicted transcriptional regulator